MNRILTFLMVLFVICACQESEKKRLPLEKEPVQTFQIATFQDTLVVGSKGTQILFRGGGLMDSLGVDVSGLVQINLQEFYSLTDFINNRLVTQTIENKPLESFGMVNIEALQGGRRLRMKPNKPYLLKFKNAKPSAQLFAGKNGTDGTVKWEQISSQLVPVIQITEKIEQLSFGMERITQRKDTLGFINPLDGTATYFTNVGIDRAVGDSSTDVDNDEFISGLGFYIPNGFGYFNCDSFYQEETVGLVVTVPSEGYSIQIIVDERNSVLIPVDCNEVNCKFLLPKDLSITAYVCKQEGEKWFFDLKRANSRDSVLVMNPVETPLQKIKEILDSLK